MQYRNNVDGFGLVAIIFHWVMALLIIGLLCVGLYMKSLTISENKLVLYGYHKEFGVLVLMLVTLRIFWRLSSIAPSLSDLPLLERVAARSVHWAFYGFMFAMPMTGWLMTSAAGLPVSFFGLFVLPNPLSPNYEVMHILKECHKYIAYGLILTIGLHTAAALKHHFIDKDSVMRRMIWPK